MQITNDRIAEMVDEQLGVKLEELIKDITSRAEKHVQSQVDNIVARANHRAKKEKKDKAGRYIAYLAAEKGNLQAAAKLAKDNGDDLIAKALGSTEISTGGAILPEEVSEELIELLRDRTVVRRAGARTMPMDGGSITMPFLSAGAAAAYVGENVNIGESQQTFGQLALSEKILAALVPLSNKLLRNSAGRAGEFVQEDVLSSMSNKEDVTFIRSLGTENEPKGMRGWVLNDFPANTFAANAVINTANVIADLVKMLRLLMETNVPMTSPAWFMSSRTWAFLLGLLDANSNPVFRTELEAGRLYGFPVFVTNAIPNNLGGGTDESELYLADTSQLIIAEALGMTVTVHDGLTYFDGSSLVSGLSQDQSIVRAIAGHDFGDRHRGKSVVLLTEVKWGS